VRWWVFVPAMALALSLDVTLMQALSVGGCVPRLWPTLLAFVAMYASRPAALGAALLTGLWLDAAHPALAASGVVPVAVPVFGPHALACLAGSWAILELRGILYRRNTFTVALAAGTCAAASALAFVAIAGIRAAYADPAPLWGPGSGAAAIGADLLSALFTAIVALLPARWLHASLGAWDFATAGPRFAPGARIGRDP
jgi:hypothetical protein